MDAPADSAVKMKGGIAFDPLANEEQAAETAPASVNPVEELKQMASKIGQQKAAKAAQIPEASIQEPQQAMNPNPTVAGYNPEMDDLALSQALDEKREMQKQALLARAAGGFGAAAMLGVGKQPVNNEAIYKALDEYAAGATDKVESRRKGVLQEEQLKQSKAKTFSDTDELAKNDPNSEISKSAREFAKKLGLKPSDNISYSNLAPLMQEARLKKQFEESVAARLEASAARKEEAKLNRELRERQFGDKQSEDDLKAVERYSSAVRKTEEWKTADKMLASVDTIQSLAKEANAQGGQALSMLGPKVAKGIAGEVGVLTEQDVTRYVQDPSLVGSIRDSLLKAKSGKLSDVSYDNIMRMVDIMKAKARDNMTQANAKGAKLLSRARPNISEQKAMSYLDPMFDESQAFPEIGTNQTVKIQAPNGDIREVPKSSMQKYLDKGGKLVQ